MCALIHICIHICIHIIYVYIYVYISVLLMHIYTYMCTITYACVTRGDVQVTENPPMAEEPRNQAVVGMSDGIPMFCDKDSRGVTPIALRTANLPDELSNKFRHIHLAALYPHEFWRLSEESGAWERAPKKPSSLSPLLHVLTDDLLMWEDGQMVVDHNKAEDDPDRIFKLRAILLYWCGDYPGLGEASGFAHSGKCACHWCEVKGVWGFGVNRESYGEYVRCALAQTYHMYTYYIMCTYCVTNVS
jgi:hypothetical protein